MVFIHNLLLRLPFLLFFLCSRKQSIVQTLTLHAFCGFDAKGRYDRRRTLLYGSSLRFLHDFHSLFLSLRIDDRHFLKGSGDILYVVLDALGQFLCHLRGQILYVAHGGKAFLRERPLDDARDCQLGSHQLHGLGLHGVHVVEHIHFHSGSQLIDTPGPTGRLPQRKEVIAHGVEDEGGKGIEVQSGFHASGIRNKHLKAVLDPFIHPFLSLFRGDLRCQDLGTVAFLPQQL